MNSVASSILNDKVFSRTPEEQSSDSVERKLWEVSRLVRDRYPSIYGKVLWHCIIKLRVGFFDDFKIDVLVLPSDLSTSSGTGFELMARCEVCKHGERMLHFERHVDGLSEPLATGVRFNSDEILDLYEISDQASLILGIAE